MAWIPALWSVSIFLFGASHSNVQSQKNAIDEIGVKKYLHIRALKLGFLLP